MTRLLAIILASSIFGFATKVIAENKISIIEISPDQSVPLKVGDNVTFKVMVEYSCDDPTGSITLVLQKSKIDNDNLLDTSLGSTMEVVTKGSGIIELEKTIVVPDTKAIQIFTPFMTQGSQTSTVDSRFYKVVK